jgi:hypothetical protein
MSEHLYSTRLPRGCLCTHQPWSLPRQTPSPLAASFPVARGNLFAHRMCILLCRQSPLAGKVVEIAGAKYSVAKFAATALP